MAPRPTPQRPSAAPRRAPFGQIMRRAAAAGLFVLSGAVIMDTDSGALAQDMGLGRGDRLVGAPFATRAPAVGQNGMAATAHPLASQVAIDVLKAGGSAVDAAIAANAALGLMEPTGCGIGGDLFAIVWDPKSQKLYGLNASGRSPKGRSLESLKAKLAGADSLPPVGSLAVTVPGAVDGWFELHDRFGRLPMTQVLAPAIGYARGGFPMSQVIAHYWALNFRRFAQARTRYGALFEEFDNARATYLVDGAVPGEGEIFRNRDLANTYEALATGGGEAFYKGTLARTMAAYFKRIGADLTYEDFASHDSEWVTPLSVTYRGYDVYQLPPNTQGVAALQMLQILKEYDLAAMGPGNPEALHLMVEAKRLAFADRARYYADPAFSTMPLPGLITQAYADKRRALIDPERALPSVGPGAPKLEDGDTTYLTVADKDGMMVSLIQSNFRGMGSGLVADGLGFMFQDRGELFSLDADHPNAYAPGKRPFHTIIPSFIMKDGKPFVSFGLMGGGMQPQGHVQVVVNMIDYGMNVQEAGDAARWRHDGSAEPTGSPEDGRGTLYVESGISDSTRRALGLKGHRVMLGNGGFGGYQAIVRHPETGVYWGATEMRKDGLAIGY